MLPVPTAISATTPGTAMLISCSKQRAAGAFLGFKKPTGKERILANWDFRVVSKGKSLDKGSVGKGVFSRVP